MVDAAAYKASTRHDALAAPVLQFLHCRTPDAWVTAAMADLPTLLLDHAALELRAAQQAQTLIRRYGGGRRRSGGGAPRAALVQRLSRLAREELRHFEQVIALLEKRSIAFEVLTASRYARTLHAAVDDIEPQRFIDTLIVGAIIEARSCERFYTLLAPLQSEDPELKSFYASLLRSEGRHYADYLALAQAAAQSTIDARVQRFLDLDADLATQPDRELRFHSGPPG